MTCLLTLLFSTPQVNPDKYKSIGNGFAVTVREDGVRGLAKGWAPTFIGYSMQGLCKFGFYEVFKIFYSDLLGEVRPASNRKEYMLSATLRFCLFVCFELCSGKQTLKVLYIICHIRTLAETTISRWSSGTVTMQCLAQGHFSTAELVACVYRCS